jgi:group I intron endonuclease
MSHIYKTTNLINGKIYVGKSLRNEDSYLGSGLQISGAISKYGKENFKKEILEECSEDVLNEREIYWIDFLNARDNRIGYNISIGGTGGNHYWTTLGEEEKIEHNKKISQSKTGATINYTDAQRTNVKAGLKRLWDEKKNDKEWLKSRANPKKYVLVNKEEFIEIENLTEYCKIHNLDKTYLCSIATGKKIYSNRGYYCFYAIDKETALTKIQELEELQRLRKEQHKENCRKRYGNSNINN